MHYAQWSNFAPGMGESQPMLHEIAPDPTNLETFPVYSLPVFMNGTVKSIASILTDVMVRSAMARSAFCK